MEKTKDGGRRGELKSSFVTGAVALVFLIVGYQSALFIHKAAVLRIVSMKARPDTVLILDRHLVDSILETVPEKEIRRQPLSVRGKEGYALLKPARQDPRVQDVLDQSAARKGKERKRETRKTETFRFNPNTVSASDLQRLGFSEKQAASIVNYRSKGGKFRRKTDFAKSFVVSDSVYRRLEDYIDIPLVDLNLADSAAFDALPGIGGYFASAMVRYREQLGGYSCKEQLMEIYRFDAEKFSSLSDLVTVAPEHVRPFRIWSLPEDSLKLHPYIGSYAAHGIVLYREHHPREEWTVEGLAAAGILKEENVSRLAACRLE